MSLVRLQVADVLRVGIAMTMTVFALLELLETSVQIAEERHVTANSARASHRIRVGLDNFETSLL